MKITGKIRKLATPQTNYKGEVKTNIVGNPIYTEYVDMAPKDEATLRLRMKKELNRIIAAKHNIGDAVFENATGINASHKKQINNDPAPRSWNDRIKTVESRLQDCTTNITTGIIDDYNNIVGSVYNRLGYSNDFIEEVRVEIVDISVSRARNKLNTALFSGLND